MVKSIRAGTVPQPPPEECLFAYYKFFDANRFSLIEYGNQVNSIGKAVYIQFSTGSLNRLPDQYPSGERSLTEISVPGTSVIMETMGVVPAGLGKTVGLLRIGSFGVFPILGK